MLIVTPIVAYMIIMQISYITLTTGVNVTKIQPSLNPIKIVTEVMPIAAQIMQKNSNNIGHR
jgi:hypothetical protein